VWITRTRLAKIPEVAGHPGCVASLPSVDGRPPHQGKVRVPGIPREGARLHTGLVGKSDVSSLPCPVILPAVAAKPSIAIVGPGNLGSALAARLHDAGYQVREIVSPESRSSQKKGRALARAVGARFAAVSRAGLETNVVWLCVPDREISSAARVLAPQTEWEGKVALHSSGALASDELQVLRRRGASVASLHPLMTFVSGSTPALVGVPFAVEGDRAAVRLARRIVRDLKGELFTIAKQKKSAYHAWGAFTSPLLLAALVTAEQVAKIAGIDRKTARRRMLPIVRQTIENYVRNGPARAFSGPLIRGDAETVLKHLKALGRVGSARDVYLALARSALANLPVRNRKSLEKILG
jgi:predicted short-subunit dehydrogenase-like oxidoreductase (DUF2520 family)